MIYFDFTTSATWGGHPVGIVRVERGASAGMRLRLGEGVQPVIYHQVLKTFFEIRPDIFELLSAGRGVVSMDVDPPEDVKRALSPSRLNSAAWLRLFESVGNWSEGETERARVDLCEGWRRHTVETRDGLSANSIPFFSAVSRPVSPTVGDAMISGGLDWDNKDLVAIDALKRLNGFVYVQFIYDVVPVRYPQFVVPQIRKKIAAFFSKVATIADYYVCDSETTRREWLEWLDESDYPLQPAISIPLSIDVSGRTGATDHGAVPWPHDLQNRQYALYVSSIEPRKNHVGAYLAWKDALRSGLIDPKRHALVFVGMNGWLSGDLVKAIAADRELAGSIVLLHGVSDAQLRALYANCRFSIFPSFHEGFGLGLAEALSFGKFVVSSDRGALPEVGGKFAEYVDPDDLPKWRDAFGLYMTDDAALAARTLPLKDYVTSDWRVAVQPILDLGIAL